MDRIPKRIIQVWGDGEEKISKFAKASVVNAKLLHPDFEYLFYDDNSIREFVDINFPAYKSIFEKFKHKIQTYDFFRYLAIYKLGGFYFDLDLFLYKNISELTEYECVFTFERIGINKYTKIKHNLHWDVGNFAFGAAPGHPFIGAIIDNCVRAQSDSKWLGTMINSIPRPFRSDAYVICTTGPGIVTRTYAESPEFQNTVKILMPENIYDKTNWTNFGNFGIDLSCYERQSAWRKRKNNVFYRYLWNFWYRKMDIKNINMAKKNEKENLPGNFLICHL